MLKTVEFKTFLFLSIPVLDLEGSPSRPGSRQPLAARPIANGVPPGTPIYPVLRNADLQPKENTPKSNIPDTVIVKIPEEAVVTPPAPIPIVAEVVSAEPAIEITVDPPEYNHLPIPATETTVTDLPPAYNSHPKQEPITEVPSVNVIPTDVDDLSKSGAPSEPASHEKILEPLPKIAEPVLANLIDSESDSKPTELIAPMDAKTEDNQPPEDQQEPASMDVEVPQKTEIAEAELEHLQPVETPAEIEDEQSPNLSADVALPADPPAVDQTSAGEVEPVDIEIEPNLPSEPDPGPEESYTDEKLPQIPSVDSALPTNTSESPVEETPTPTEIALTDCPVVGEDVTDESPICTIVDLSIDALKETTPVEDSQIAMPDSSSIDSQQPQEIGEDAAELIPTRTEDLSQPTNIDEAIVDNAPVETDETPISDPQEQADALLEQVPSVESPQQLGTEKDTTDEIPTPSEESLPIDPLQPTLATEDPSDITPYQSEEVLPEEEKAMDLTNVPAEEASLIDPSQLTEAKEDSSDETPTPTEELTLPMTKDVVDEMIAPPEEIPLLDPSQLPKEATDDVPSMPEVASLNDLSPEPEKDAVDEVFSPADKDQSSDPSTPSEPIKDAEDAEDAADETPTEELTDEDVVDEMPVPPAEISLIDPLQLPDKAIDEIPSMPEVVLSKDQSPEPEKGPVDEIFTPADKDQSIDPLSPTESIEDAEDAGDPVDDIPVVTEAAALIDASPVSEVPDAKKAALNDSIAPTETIEDANDETPNLNEDALLIDPPQENESEKEELDQVLIPTGDEKEDSPTLKPSIDEDHSPTQAIDPSQIPKTSEHEIPDIDDSANSSELPTGNEGEPDTESPLPAEVKDEAPSDLLTTKQTQDTQEGASDEEAPEPMPTDEGQVEPLPENGPSSLPIIAEEPEEAIEEETPEIEAELAEPSPLTASLIDSLDLPTGEPLSDVDGKLNSLKPTESPPPPYSSLPRTPKSESSPEASMPANASQLDEEDAVLLAANAVLAESPLPAEASAPVVPSPNRTPPPATSSVDVPSTAKPPKPPGPTAP